MNELDSTAAFLDTNILIRHFVGDHPVHSPAATNVINQIAAGRVVHLSDTVVFETVFTMSKTYGASREVIAEALLEFLDFSSVVLPGKTIYRDVFALWLERGNLSFADCYHLQLTKRLGLGAIISFDQGLSVLREIARIEPA